MKVYLISLGCSKNLVDSEILLGLLKENGFSFVDNLEHADIIILNTCAFIEEARLEAESLIRKIEKNKKNQIFVVCGCLVQLEGKKLKDEFPKVDLLFGVYDFYKIPRILIEIIRKGISDRGDYIHTTEFGNVCDCWEKREITTPQSYAYLKIADGCSNRCAYCLIPSIRGLYKERPVEDIVKEAKKISDEGRKEIIIISQDTSIYGLQVYKKMMLDKVVEKISKISAVKWIRILYTYPRIFSTEFIKRIFDNEKVCRYIDLPIQHTSDNVLKKMGRPSRKVILNVIENIRKIVPDIKIRTTIMVGFPSETEADFDILLQDIKDIRFDNLGCFIYSNERGTKAFDMKGQVSQQIKELRLKTVMDTQRKIVSEINKQYIGQKFDVLVDDLNSGHTRFQTPEVDGKTIFKNLKGKFAVGDILKAEIVGIKDVYDLVAVS